MIITTCSSHHVKGEKPLTCMSFAVLSGFVARQYVVNASVLAVVS